jgi:hypothetical protein
VGVLPYLWLLILLVVNVIAAVMYWRGRWQDYDPTWLVRLAESQCPDDESLARALSACTRAKHPGSLIVHFVKSNRPNLPGSEWQFSHSVSLTDPDHGELILDLLQDGRVGSIELVDQLIQPSA